MVQSMPDASPAKWHLAHTTWFFETFLLKPMLPKYRPRFPQYDFLFNSYYNAIGERIARDRRGLLSRPTIGEVERYRGEVDDRMGELARLGRPGDPRTPRRPRPEPRAAASGIAPDRPQARLRQQPAPARLPRARRRQDGPRPRSAGRPYPAGVRAIGHEGLGFCFDNETPRHPEYVGAFELASRPTTNASTSPSSKDGGYDRPEFWLSDGWGARTRQGWSAPLYWEKAGKGWKVMTLAGLLDLPESEPVSPRQLLRGRRLRPMVRRPARHRGRVGDRRRRPARSPATSSNPGSITRGRHRASPTEAPPPRCFGDVWEWTRSPYTPYPGYRPAAGALGEYNGKFMCNQIILRGGSCATPKSHIRATYRNFFGPEARWQFAGHPPGSGPGMTGPASRATIRGSVVIVSPVAGKDRSPRRGAQFPRQVACGESGDATGGRLSCRGGPRAAQAGVTSDSARASRPSRSNEFQPIIAVADVPVQFEPVDRASSGRAATPRASRRRRRCRSGPTPAGSTRTDAGRSRGSALGRVGSLPV